jgi:hypothetical protein
MVSPSRITGRRAVLSSVNEYEMLDTFLHRGR